MIKAGLVIPPNADHSLSIVEAYADLVDRTRHARMSLMSAPPVSDLTLALDYIFICARCNFM